ncbi:MAG: hypothetical protein GX774_05300 [Armatimonadetes bacterium]|nr:hypothetical protein [Armatimonadota bacterium]
MTEPSLPHSLQSRLTVALAAAARAEPSRPPAALAAAFRSLLLARLLQQAGVPADLLGEEDEAAGIARPAREPLAALIDSAGVCPDEAAAGSAPRTALGPETLAAIYEHLRAGRHRDGVYYTPEGEVRRMCREALRARLAWELRWPDDAPALLQWLYGDDPPALTPEEALALYTAVARLRIFDPAAGCGALLVGMGLQMWRGLQRLAPLLPPDGRTRLAAAGLPHPDDAGAARAHLAGRCLFGIDVDAAAARVARQRLLLFGVAGGEPLAPGAVATLWATLRRHVLVGDGLRPAESAEAVATQLALFNASGDASAPVGGEGEPAPPVRWHEAFPEAFARPEPGFDIVLGNPPYVRQELLAADYKAGATRACRALLPAPSRLDGKSDLYVYFYALGLGLLRSGGALCLLSSNSWLDVDFGEPLRALLTTHARVLAVIESATDSSFADARVNPAILLARRCPPEADPEGRVRFIRTRRRLGEEETPAEIARWLSADRRLELPAGRVVPVAQRVLAAAPDEPWGGRYLRAPALLQELLDRGAPYLCRLDALAAVRFGIKTGANDFFYLEDVTAGEGGDTLRQCRNGAGHLVELEARFLVPALRSPRELTAPELRPEMARACLFVCNLPRDLLAGTAALRYIEWGEHALAVHRRPSVRGRAHWYQVAVIPPPPVLHPLIAFERACAAHNPAGILCDANLVGITPHDARHAPALAACLASSLGVALREIVGIANLGQGALKMNPAYLARLPVPDLRRADPAALARLADAWAAVREAPFPSLLQGEPDAAWQALDAAVLSLLGEAAPPPAAVRAAARELVAARLAKAASRRRANHLAR